MAFCQAAIDDSGNEPNQQIFVLAGFVARFIFHYGSLDALWGDRACSAKRDAKPRYRLLIASRSFAPSSSTGSANR